MWRAPELPHRQVVELRQLAAAQAVEHYEITRYGTLRTWAEELGLDEAVALLQVTLDEEEATDQALTARGIRCQSEGRSGLRLASDTY